MKFLKYCLLGLLVFTQAAFAQLYDELIQDALAARDAGDLPRAESLLREAYPIPDDKSEVALLLGMVVAFQGRYDEALALFDQGLAGNPADSELRMARARVLFWQGETSAASRQLDELLAQDPQHAEARALARQLDAGNWHHQFSYAYGRSRVDVPGFADWHDHAFEYRYRQNEQREYYGRVEHSHRFGLYDTLLEGGLLFNRNGRLPLALAAGFTPNADFLPEYLFRAGTSLLLNDGGLYPGATVLGVQYQLSSYLNGNTHRLGLGLEYYVPGTALWLTPGIGMVRDQDGRDSFSWSLGAHWQLRDSSRIGLSYSDAAETENLLTTGTRSWRAYLLQDLTARWALQLNFSRMSRSNSYTRESLNLALQYRF